MPSMADEIAKAVALLRAGELVAFPTETVYGLGADAENSVALARIFAAKRRPADHPLIVHLPGIELLSRWAIDIPDTAYALAKAFWPGPLTLILKRGPNVPDAVTGGQQTVGLRVPDHPVALALLGGFGGGIAAPSANRYGRISPTMAGHVREEFGDQVALVLDGGPCALGIESTIVDLSRGSPQLLRPGAITVDQIARACGLALGRALAPESSPAPQVPGSHAAHYAPATPLAIVATERLRDHIAKLRLAGRRCAVLAYSDSAELASPALLRMLPADPAGYAHALYAAMRELDGVGAELIVVEAVPGGEGWLAVADRLRRAAAGSGAAAADDRP